MNPVVRFSPADGPLQLNSLEIEVVAQLRELASKLEKGDLLLKRFSLTVNKETQTLEIEA